jgi:hypothetical protein
MRGERKIAQLALDAIAQRRIERTVPARPQLGDDAARADVGEQAAQRSADRHARRDLRHHADVEALGVELAPRHLAGFVLAPDDAHVARRPAQAVAGAKAELAHVDAGPVVALLRIDAARDLLEVNRLDRLVEAQRDRAQGKVDRGARRLAVLQLEPAAQRTVAFAQFEGQGDMAAQLAQLGARQVGVDPAAPAPPVAVAREERLVEAAAHAEAVAPARRRRRVEADVVVAQAVADDQLDIGERERLGVARLVDPAQRAGADHELVLAEEPVGGRVVVGGALAAREVEAGDTDAAALVAPHVEARAVDQKLREARLEREQRTRRQGGEDARQGERDALLGIEDAHVAQLHRRHPTARLRTDGANANRHAEHGAGARFDGRTPLFDVRQNQPVK